MIVKIVYHAGDVVALKGGIYKILSIIDKKEGLYDVELLEDFKKKEK